MMGIVLVLVIYSMHFKVRYLLQRFYGIYNYFLHFFSCVIGVGLIIRCMPAHIRAWIR